MPRRKHLIEFPQAKGNFWHLIWVGKITFDKTVEKVDLFFVNKNQCNDILRDFDLDNIVKIKVPASYLVEYKVGVIYDVQKRVLTNYFETLPKSRTIRVSCSTILYPTQKTFPLLSSDYFPISRDYLFNDLKYYTYYYSDKFRPNLRVLLTSYCLADYFLFRSDKLISKLLSGEIFNGIIEQRIFEDESTGKKVFLLVYDNQKLKDSEADMISKLLMVKNDAGREMITSVYSSLTSFFINSEINKDDLYLKGKHLFVDFSFENYEMEILGKEHKYKDVELGEEVLREAFLAYEIKKFKFREEAFEVDKILLLPINSKTSTADRNNHIKSTVFRVLPPKTKKLSLLFNSDSSVQTHQVEDYSDTYQNNPFDISVEFKRRNEQDGAFETITCVNEDEYVGLTREIENFLEEMSTLIENYTKKYTYIKNISNYRYFEKVLESLELNKQVRVERNLLREKKSSEPYYFSSPNGESVGVYIAELVYEESYTYLIEFGKGLIGVFYPKLNSKKIPVVELMNICKDFVEQERFLKNRGLLWTYISNKKDDYERDFSIIIQMGVEHTRSIEGEDASKAIDETVERIFNHRIKRKTI